ncbi:MAG: ARMT1-like domain-containing protein [Planctomycetia bacterium]|nr:ARMT1-like domain-containing protein [Planctomycetia bacterium]
MPASPDCLICLMRQSLEAARLAVADSRTHLKILESVMRLILEEGVDVNPPFIGQKIHRLIREISCNPDPYKKEKQFFNSVMLDQFDLMQKRMRESSDPLDCAVRWAISGNSIDFALGKPDKEKVVAALDTALELPLNGSLSDLREEIQKAHSILYLTDNAGEIVCDRLLIELLTADPYRKDLTVAVRGKPILNDAIREDAEMVGLKGIVPVIDNGNDGLGTMLEYCSPPFIEHFQTADLIIAKGLANYETLIENKGPVCPRRIAYLFKSKCPFISHFAGTTVGDLVIRIF